MKERGPKIRAMAGEGWSGDTKVRMQNGTIEMAAEFQKSCYHISTVSAKINLEVWKLLRGKWILWAGDR